MLIESNHQAMRAMKVAFDITSKMIGKSDSRRAQIMVTAKHIIATVEAYKDKEKHDYLSSLAP